MSSKNPLLENLDFPKFDSISPEHVVPAVTKMVADAKAKLDAIEESIQPTWNSIGLRLEELEREIQAVWGPVRHLTGVANTDPLREAYNKVQADVVDLGLRIAQSLPIYQATKKLRGGSDFSRLDKTQQRIIELGLRNARLSGIELEGKDRERFNEISRRLSELSIKFSNNVLDSTKAFSYEITSASDVNGMPTSFLQLTSQSWNSRHQENPRSTPSQGPWLVTLDMPSYLPLLEHCPNRAIRETVYRAYVTKASSGPFDNLPLIEEILTLRQEKARLLGFKTYADMSTSQKMARDVTQAESLLNQLLQSTRPVAIKEQTEIEVFAESKGLIDKLMPWDMFFYAEKMREEHYGLSDDELRPYFPFPYVLEGLFKLVHKIFGITVKRNPMPIATWHPSVMLFDIFDEANQQIASFYLDPYSRPENKKGGAWMDTCIGRGYHKGKLYKPVAYLVCNSTPPVGDIPSLMTFREVETLFHEFGHGLQHMLTKVDYADAAGINGIEWDAVELPSQFMENWCYHKPTLQALTSHIKTGDRLPDALFEKIHDAKNFRAANMMLRQLHFGILDLELHHRFTPGDDVIGTNRALVERILVTPTIPEDRFICSFSHIFAGGYAAGYYSYKWAEVLSADAFSAFEDVGLDNEKAIIEVGGRFRDTVLALGGSAAPEQVFEQFRGRPKSIQPLLKHSGLA